PTQIWRRHRLPARRRRRRSQDYGTIPSLRIKEAGGKVRSAGACLNVFGILDIIVLILIRRRNCGRCGRAFWAAPPHSGRAVAVGRESYLCVCGHKYETGRREFAHLSREEKRKYLWSGLVRFRPSLPRWRPLEDISCGGTSPFGRCRRFSDFWVC